MGDGEIASRPCKLSCEDGEGRTDSGVKQGGYVGKYGAGGLVLHNLGDERLVASCSSLMLFDKLLHVHGLGGGVNGRVGGGG